MRPARGRQQLPRSAGAVAVAGPAVPGRRRGCGAASELAGLPTSSPPLAFAPTARGASSRLARAGPVHAQVLRADMHLHRVLLLLFLGFVATSVPPSTQP